MKELKELLLQQDTITFLIAVVSFIVSIGSSIVSAFKSRESYTVEVIDYAYRNSEVIQFLICITNNSNTPLSVIDISVFGTVCELYPKKIWGNPGEWNFRHTSEFPVAISAHSCRNLYLEFCGENFESWRLAPGIETNFEIRSTRKLVQKSVSLGKTSHYLHTRE